MVFTLCFLLATWVGADEGLPAFLVGWWTGDQGESALEIHRDGKCILWFGNTFDSMGAYYTATYEPSTRTLSLGPQHHFRFDPKRMTLQGNRKEWINTCSYACRTPLTKMELKPK